MNRKISQSEKIDIFLALAIGYSSENVPENIFENLSALSREDLNQLKERFYKFESLSAEKKKLWLTFWIEKLKNRGKTLRLDENIHSEHIAEVLKVEPFTVQKLIFDKLPESKVEDIKNIIPDKAENQKIPKPTVSKNLPVEEISEIVRERFLSNFVAFENVYKPKEIDELKREKLYEFIHKLGIRETAISCRGIKTKENLAVFLKPFQPETTKQIALKIKELEEINPLRVLRSEKIVSEIFQGVGDYKEKLKELSLRLLACAFVSRDETSKKYTAMKLTVSDGERFLSFTEQFENDTGFYLEFGDEILELAKNFKENNVI